MVIEEDVAALQNMMIQKKIRVHKKDSAFTYAILESLDGMVSFSTLDKVDGHNAKGQDFRDLALFIPDGFVEEMAIIIEGLRKKFPVIELE